MGTKNGANVAVWETMSVVTNALSQKEDVDALTISFLLGDLVMDGEIT